MIKHIIRLGLLIATLVSNSQAFSAQYLFTPRAIVQGDYSDNIFLEDEDEESDFITVLSAGFDFEAQGKVSGLQMTIEPGYAFYQDNDDLDDWRLLGNLRAYAAPTKRTQLEFRNRIERTEDPLPVAAVPDIRAPVPLIPVDNTVRRDRQPYLQYGSNLNFGYQFGREDTFNVGYAYSFLNNDDDDVDDNQRHNPYADLTYWFAPLWSFFARAAYTRGLFDGDQSDFRDVNGTVRLLRRFTRHFDGFFQYDQIWRDYDDAGEVEIENEVVNQRDFQTYSPSIGFNWAVTEDVPLTMRLGYFYRQLDGGSNDGGPVIDLNLGSTWEFRRGSIYITGASGYRTADFGAESLGFEIFGQTLGAAHYFFTRHLRGDILASFRRSKFKDTRDDRKDNVFRSGVALTYQALPWMYLRAGYVFRTLDSTRSEDDYTENRGIVQITFQPERPWRF